MTALPPAGPGPAGQLPTPAQTIGPFFRFATEWLAGRDLDRRGAAGAVRVGGSVFDGEGAVVPDALLEAYYPGRGLARCLTDETGSYEFWTAKPPPDPAGQAPHLELSVFARGLLQRLWTRIYFPDEPDANGQDPFLRSVGDAGRAATLVAVPDGRDLRFDIRLQGERETVFLAW